MEGPVFREMLKVRSSRRGLGWIGLDSPVGRSVRIYRVVSAR